MPCRAIQFGWVIVKSSDKMWSTGRRMANQTILKETKSEYSSEGLILKLQYFGHIMQRLIGKVSDGKD